MPRFDGGILLLRTQIFDSHSILLETDIECTKVGVKFTLDADFQNLDGLEVVV